MQDLSNLNIALPTLNRCLQVDRYKNKENKDKTSVKHIARRASLPGGLKMLNSLC